MYTHNRKITILSTAIATSVIVERCIRVKLPDLIICMGDMNEGSSSMLLLYDESSMIVIRQACSSLLWMIIVCV
jgi:hypothetical protein